MQDVLFIAFWDDKESRIVSFGISEAFYKESLEMFLLEFQRHFAMINKV